MLIKIGPEIPVPHTKSTERSPYWEAHSRTACHRIPHDIHNLKFHNRIPNSALLDPCSINCLYSTLSHLICSRGLRKLYFYNCMPDRFLQSLFPYKILYAFLVFHECSTSASHLTSLILFLLYRDGQIFWKSISHLKILGAREMTCSKRHYWRSKNISRPRMCVPSF
jgi:hypothetical protein